MRTLVLLGWLLVPVAFGAYHFGPGQERLRLDDTAAVLAEADRLAAAEDWQSAVAKYDAAQAMLPEGRVEEVRRVRLKRAKAQMFAHQLPEASAALQELVEQLQGDKTASAQLRDEAREAQAERPVLHHMAETARGTRRARVGTGYRKRAANLSPASRES